MGFFSDLFGGSSKRKVEIVPDHIWMTPSGKFGGVKKEAEERGDSDTVAILLVAHFPDVLSQLDEIASSQAWKVPCTAVSADDLNAELAKSLSFDEEAMIDIIVGERHPLPSVDDQLESFADQIPCRCRFSHHVSLEDAVMRVFVSDLLKTLLQQLGMNDKAAIQSPIVSRRIRRAQQRIEGKTTNNLDCGSAAEWFTKNCPEMPLNQ